MPWLYVCWFYIYIYMSVPHILIANTNYKNKFFFFFMLSSYSKPNSICKKINIFMQQQQQTRRQREWMESRLCNIEEKINIDKFAWWVARKRERRGDGEKSWCLFISIFRWLPNLSNICLWCVCRWRRRKLGKKN